jgi:hypothetical protein
MPDKRRLLCLERFRFPRLRLLPDLDERELLTLIDERPVDVFAARRALNDNPPSEAA